jgi:hypothetical protein
MKNMIDTAKRKIIAAIKGDGTNRFRAYEGRQYNWSLQSTLDDGVKTLPDIYVTEAEEIIGYIQNISINLAFAEARIGHFATVTDMVRQGVGRNMVGSFARAVSEKFGTKQIVFSENSTKYIEAGYPGFFAAIGARPIEVGNRHPDWYLPVDELIHRP